MKLIILLIPFTLGTLASASVDADETPASNHEPTTTINETRDVDEQRSQYVELGTGFAIDWYRIAGGGGTSTGSGFSLQGTIGQAEAGEMSNATFSLAGGYWTSGASVDPATPCPADLNGDGEINVSDLLVLLSSWGLCPVDEPCPADLNKDGEVNVSDLLQLLSAWGTCPI